MPVPAAAAPTAPTRAATASVCPTSDPGYFFWRDATTGAITRRTEWFVTKSPEGVVRRPADELHDFVRAAALHGSDADALAQARRCIPQGTPDWVAKLDTVIHELYHIDPGPELPAPLHIVPTATASDALHSPTYFEDVAALVQQYLATQPDQRLLEFLEVRFQRAARALRRVAGTTFRSFPSYPRRYREAVADQPMMADVQAAPVERIIDPSVRIFSEDDLQFREFTGTGSRQIASYTTAVAA